MPSNDIEREYLRQPCFCFILAGEPDEGLLREAKSLLDGDLAGVSIRGLVPGRSAKFSVTHEVNFPHEQFTERLRAFALEHCLSWALYPGTVDIPEFRVLVMDMDSTLIGQEVIEELAGFAGVREEVARVTTAAMEGKLDFAGALRERVRHLAGQPASILETVRKERIRANPGAGELIAGLKRLGVRTAVVSGGFRSITVPFAEGLGIDLAVANELEIEGGKLTGRVLGEIVDSEVKRRVLLDLCAQSGDGPQVAVAIGDGANDLPMIREAGLGIAYRAKPVVRRAAHAAINRERLDDALLLMGTEAPADRPDALLLGNSDRIR